MFFNVQLLIDSEGSEFKLVPEIYSVPNDKVTEEEAIPGSQERVPTGRIPFMWAQSLYVVGHLLRDKFIAPGEIDPTNRRLCTLKRPDCIVQVIN